MLVVLLSGICTMSPSRPNEKIIARLGYDLD